MYCLQTKRTTVLLISAIGTIFFTITPTCQWHTRTIQTSKVRGWTRCNQSSYMDRRHRHIYTHTHTHIQKAYVQQILVNSCGKWNLQFGCIIHVSLCNSLSTNIDTHTMQDRLYLDEIKSPANITSNESFTQGTAKPQNICD